MWAVSNVHKRRDPGAAQRRRPQRWVGRRPEAHINVAPPGAVKRYCDIGILFVLLVGVICGIAVRCADGVWFGFGRRRMPLLEAIEHTLGLGLRRIAAHPRGRFGAIWLFLGPVRRWMRRERANNGGAVDALDPPIHQPSRTDRQRHKPMRAPVVADHGDVFAAHAPEKGQDIHFRAGRKVLGSGAGRVATWPVWPCCNNIRGKAPRGKRLFG